MRYQDRLNPIPKYKCANKLLNRAIFGIGVLLAATPNPNAGCMIKNGKPTVMIPKRSAYTYGLSGISPTWKSQIMMKAMTIPIA